MNVQAPAQFRYYCKKADAAVWHIAFGGHALCTYCLRRVPASEIVVQYAVSIDFRHRHTLTLPAHLLKAAPTNRKDGPVPFVEPIRNPEDLDASSRDSED